MKVKYEFQPISFVVAAVGSVVIALGMAYLGKHIPEWLADIVFVFLILAVCILLIGLKVEKK